MFDRFKRKRHEVFSDRDGASLAVGGEVIEAWQWEDVLRIVAYKVDAYSVDQIRLDVELPDDKCAVLTEDDPGFSDFQQAMIEVLGVEATWKRIWHPPFEENRTVLFDREAT